MRKDTIVSPSPHDAKVLCIRAVARPQTWCAPLPPLNCDLGASLCPCHHLLTEVVVSREAVTGPTGGIPASGSMEEESHNSIGVFALAHKPCGVEGGLPCSLSAVRLRAVATNRDAPAVSASPSAPKANLSSPMQDLRFAIVKRPPRQVKNMCQVLWYMHVSEEGYHSLDGVEA